MPFDPRALGVGALAASLGVAGVGYCAMTRHQSVNLPAQDGAERPARKPAAFTPGTDPVGKMSASLPPDSPSSSTMDLSAATAGAEEVPTEAELRQSREPTPSHARQGVDPAALTLGGVAAAIALVTGEGAWTLTSSLVGIALLCVVVGYHEIQPRSMRGVALILGYSLVVGLLFVLVLAYVLQLVANRGFGGAPQWLFDVSGTPAPDCTYAANRLTCQVWIENAIASVTLNASLWFLLPAIPLMVWYELHRSKVRERGHVEGSAKDVA